MAEISAAAAGVDSAAETGLQNPSKASIAAHRWLELAMVAQILQTGEDERRKEARVGVQKTRSRLAMAQSWEDYERTTTIQSCSKGPEVPGLSSQEGEGTKKY